MYTHLAVFKIYKNVLEKFCGQYSRRQVVCIKFF
jgi:hypothetical protein